MLFGNVLGVTTTDLWVTRRAGGRWCSIAVALLYKRLLVVSFDPILGQTLGLRTTPCARVCS